MPKIAEKIEFMKGQTVEICTKTRIGRKEKPKKREKFIKIKIFSVFL